MHLLLHQSIGGYRGAKRASNGKDGSWFQLWLLEAQIVALVTDRFDQWRSDWLDKPDTVPTLKHLSRRSIVARRCLTTSSVCPAGKLAQLG